MDLLDSLGGFLLGLFVMGLAWALWPRRGWDGETVSLHHVAKMADVVQLHEGTLAQHERRLNKLRGKGDGA